MIIARAPLRISFAGGGSDLPAYFMKSPEPGLVVSAAIQKYVYVILNKKFDEGIRVSYSHTENVRHVSEVRHDIIRETLKYFSVSRGVEIVTVADVPGQGTGLGSSSAMTVALVCALAKYTNRYYTPYDCAKLACDIEIEICGHPIGYQDQFASAFGGLNTIEFRKREVRVDGIHPMCGLGLLEDNLILFWVGSRKDTANMILTEQNVKFSQKELFEETKSLTLLAKEMATNLWANDVNHFGSLLDKSWQIKKSISDKITNDRIDRIYKKAFDNGATGGKILGAGGGGFMLLWASPDRHKTLQFALSLKSMPVKIDTQGVRIIEQK